MFDESLYVRQGTVLAPPNHLPTDNPMDWHLDARERGWQWSCAVKVLAAWPGQATEVSPEPPDVPKS